LEEELAAVLGGAMTVAGRKPPMTLSIDLVWVRIRNHEGQTFVQMRGGEFTYSVRGGAVYPDRTNRALPRSQFEQALAFVPLSSTVPVQHLQGPSYLYAILMDPRIRSNDW
jgi:hypothetical protein